MKTFFMRFLCFICIVLCTVTVYGTESPPPKNPKIVAFMEYIQNAKEQAQSQSPEQASLFEHGDKYNLLSPFYLMQTDGSPLSGTKGYGPWKNLPFGQVRLVSCHSGTKYEKNIFAALQVDLKPGVLIKKPVLSSSLPAANNVQFLYPIQYPLPSHKTKTDSYAGLVIFPILAHVTAPNEPFILTVDSTLTGCQESGCETLNVPLSLTLDNSEQFPTGVCPLMMTFLQDVPIPNKKNVTAKAYQETNGDIQLVFDFTNPTSLVSVQMDNDFSFEELSKRIIQKTAFLTLRPDTPIKHGTILNLKVVTSFGLFDVPTPVIQGPFQQPVTDLPWTPIVMGGLFLFFLTPVWGLFWLQKPKNKKTLKSDTKKILLTLGATTLLTACVWQIGWLTPIDIVQTSTLFILICFIVLIGLIRRPHIGLLSTLVLFWIVPKPYLSDVFTAHVSEPFFMVCWWGLTLMMPFYWVYRYPTAALKFFRFLSQTPHQARWIVRLPVLGLLGWLCVASIGNWGINKRVAPYAPYVLNQVLDEGKIAFVSVEPPVCFSCTWNKAVQMKTGYARFFARRGQLVPFYVPADSEAGQTLIRQFGQSELPLNLLYGPSNKNGVVLPTTVDYFDLKEHLNAVKEP